MPIFTLTDIRRDVRELSNTRDAEFLQRFFKTALGEYGEGDRFLGVRVPQLRALVRTHRGLAHEDAIELLHSHWHEERLLALLLFVEKYRRGAAPERERIYQAYMTNTAYINNWDLVDASAEHIVGPHLDPDDIGVLERLAVSDSLWERRIAILSSFHWIRQGTFHPTLRLAEILLTDSHDLIHKAVGWMLREVGKRNIEREEEFLKMHYRVMPRTMLRYAIERLPETRRQQYLRGDV